MKNHEKLISVIMGIYNCGDTLSDAIDSILAQTYKAWELILCDDGSNDNTIEIAKKYVAKYSDKIKLLENEKNEGLNFTLNRCLSIAKGEYIARMDGDDLCSEERFAKQVKILDLNPNIAIVSSGMSFFDNSGVWGEIYTPQTPTKNDFIHSSPFCHAAAMVRKCAYMAVEGYTVDKKLLRVEDYHLWIKMYANGYQGLNIQETLYQMRDDHNAIKRKKFKDRLNEVYVKSFAIKKLHLPFWYYLYCIKPVILGCLPLTLYVFLHKYKLKKN